MKLLEDQLRSWQGDRHGMGSRSQRCRGSQLGVFLFVHSLGGWFVVIRHYIHNDDDNDSNNDNYFMIIIVLYEYVCSLG